MGIPLLSHLQSVSLLPIKVKMLYGCSLWLLLPVCPLPSVPTAFGPTLGAATHDSLHVILWRLCASFSTSEVPWVTSGATFQAPYFSPCFAFETQMYLINYHLVPVATSTERLKGTSPSRGTDLTFDSHCSFPQLSYFANSASCRLLADPSRLLPTALDRLVVSLDFFFSPHHIRVSKSSWFHL